MFVQSEKFRRTLREAGRHDNLWSFNSTTWKLSKMNLENQWD
jgi:hypothetical protein